MARDKANPDIFWLRDKNLEVATNLSAPEVLAEEIIADLESALDQFRGMAESLEE
jgi:type I restriction enzyme M protein